MSKITNSTGNSLESKEFKMENKKYINSYKQSLKHAVKAVIMILAVFTLTLPLTTNASAKSAPESFASLVKKASPSVVYISTKKIIRQRPFSPFGQNDPLRELLERFYGNRMPRNVPQTGLGTGFVIDKEGYILTNNHVVDSVDEIKVTLEDESVFEAKGYGYEGKGCIHPRQIKVVHEAFSPTEKEIEKAAKEYQASIIIMGSSSKSAILENNLIKNCNSENNRIK